MKKSKTQKIFVAICVFTLLLTLSAALLYKNFVDGADFVKLDESKLASAHRNITLLDGEGGILYEPCCGYGNYTSLSALPEYVYMAFVAVEDKRFFKHDGVDLLRVGSALIANVKSGGKREGASTITQQLVKNTHLSGEKTYKRKLNEMILAKRLERLYCKRDILEMYLNTIYFGRGSRGIESAANVYFGKTAANLTVSEAATLAATVKAPSVYAPDKNVQKCTKRRNKVLQLMHEQGVIDKSTYLSAVSAKVQCAHYDGNGIRGYTQGAIAEACKLLNLSEQRLLEGKYVIETFMQPDLQRKVADIVSVDVTRDKKGNLANLSAAICTADGKISAFCSRGCSALTKRQIGSTAKPFAVYAPAFERGVCTVASPILDEKTDFNGYKPVNAGGYKGWTTVKDAVLTSSNVAAVKTLNALTLPVAESYLAKLGLSGKQDLSLALGNINGGMNEQDLLHCYTAFADGGVAHKARFVSKIYDENGLVYDSADQCKRVFSGGATYLMNDLLRRNALYGTAKKLSASGIKVCAKTGTVGNKCGNTDALTVAYTTSDVFVVRYCGQLPNSVNGTTAPCSLTAKLLAATYANKKPTNFAKPSEISYIKLNEGELYRNQRIVFDPNGKEYPFIVKDEGCR